VTPELALERAAQRLVGRTLRRVWYVGAGTLAQAVHEVAFAVHLELDDGRRVRIATSRELATRHGHGIALTEQRTLAGDAREVTALPPWHTAPITCARVHWRLIEDALRGSLRTGLAIGIDHLTRCDFPQALELAFAGGSVFVAAARLATPTTAEGMASSLLVVAGAGELVRLGLR
jgi:hypothetical protein